MGRLFVRASFDRDRRDNYRDIGALHISAGPLREILLRQLLGEQCGMTPPLVAITPTA